MSIKSIFLIIFLFLIISITGYVLAMAYPNFTTPYSHIQNDKPIKVTLEYWGLWDNSDNWDEIIDKFENKTFQLNGRKINVSVNYTKKDYATYEKEVNQSKEKENGPNIFIINNNWFANYLEEIEPLNNNNAISKEYDLLSYSDIPIIFPRRAITDIVHQELVYSVPLYSDSLVLYYNKDLFEEAEIETAPKSWKEFKKYVKKLTILEGYDEISQAGTSLGTGTNINRSSDILSLLIMQGGGNVIDKQGNIDIGNDIEIDTTSGTKVRSPGKRAIEFYSEFSNSKKEIYSWNNEQSHSIENFANEKTAIMFGYNYHTNNLLAINPDLNYGISQMPQLENSTKVNFSNVWLPVISKVNNCKVEPIEFANEIDCTKLSWSFLSFATEKENSEIYLDSTKKAAARKDLISQQINLNNNISAFASQVDSAVSYNKFNDQIDNILVDMLDKIALDRNRIDEIIEEAVGKIESLK
ncbi:MAG: extracellular solute-binding protein, partial [Candidatus Pacebacteria bacterium]|nr:extracellular solute-binding protein [Candidatus Paceibacterota bacterium]